MTRPRKKSASTAGTAEAKEKTPSQESTHSLPTQVESDKLPLRCPTCGVTDPGFADSADMHQQVTCDGCGTEGVLGRWVDAARLAEAILSCRSPERGFYDLGWSEGRVIVSHRPSESSAALVVAVIWPHDDQALMSHYDVKVHHRLIGVLDDHVTVREES